MKKCFFCLLLVFTLIGCSKKKYEYNEEIDKNFTEYINNYTREAFSNSPIDVNFYFLNPELFGITDVEYKGMESVEPNKESIEAIINEVEAYDYYSLSYKNRLTYEVLIDSLEMELELVDYYYYQTSLGSYLGYQAQLPLLLYLYRFDDVSDVEDYYTYLEKTEDDFSQFIDFEVKRKNKNLATASSILEGTIEQCEAVYEDTSYFLIETFENRVKDFENKEDLIAKNKTAVRKFQDAYKYLADEIESKLLVENDSTIHGYENGTKYYELLVKKSTGSNKSIAQIKSDIENAITDLSRRIGLDDLSLNVQTDYSKVLADYIACDDLWNDFPTLKDENGNIININYKLNQIDESLEDNFSPAAYLTSPLDGMNVEQIVINNKQIMEQVENADPNYVYTVMSHEGVPGHMYQNLYFKTSSNYNYLRGLLDCVGYTEGWATYVQRYAMKYTGLDEEEYKNMQNIELLSGYIMCYLDIQINYYGWSKQHVINYLTGNGNGEELAGLVYEQIVETPCNSLEYYYGYYQMESLKAKAKRELGKNYSDLIFHTFVLDMGSMPFYILEKHIEDINNYIK